MTNCFDLRCPVCGKSDDIDVRASVWMRVTEDGTDGDLSHDGTHAWDDNSPARCADCTHSGKVGDFHPNEYMAHFRTTAGPAEDIFVADTPEQALELARKAFREDPGKFGLSPTNLGYLNLQEIRIVNQDGEELLSWMTDEYRLQVSAPQLLKALEAQIQATREIIDAWNNTDKLYGAVQDLINDLDHQSQSAQAVLEAHETSDIGSAIDELEQSLNASLEAIDQAKGGAA